MADTTNATGATNGWAASSGTTSQPAKQSAAAHAHAHAVHQSHHQLTACTPSKSQRINHKQAAVQTVCSGKYEHFVVGWKVGESGRVWANKQSVPAFPRVHFSQPPRRCVQGRPSTVMKTCAALLRPPSGALTPCDVLLPSQSRGVPARQQNNNNTTNNDDDDDDDVNDDEDDDDNDDDN